MCDMCDGKSLEEVLEGERAMVERFGWMAQAVGYADSYHGRLPWMYSVGLTAGLGHPELIVLGLSVNSAHHLLGDVAEQIRLGAHFSPGDTLVHHSLLVRFRAVHNSHFRSSDLFSGWLGYYDRWGDEPERRALQLVLPMDGWCTCHRQPDLALPAHTMGRTAGPPTRARRRPRHKPHHG